MKQMLIKNAIVIAMIMLMVAPVFALALPAQAFDPWENTPIGDETGLGNTDPRTIAARVINVILGFLGIVAVIIILLGGFKWMTASGNEEKIGEARKLIIAGIVGLIIIIGSFAIATFVINSLLNATNAN